MPDIGAAFSPITEDDGWFLGEDKTLYWDIDDGTVGSAPSGADAWTVVLYLRQQPDAVDLVLEKPATITGAVAAVEIARDDTKDLPGGEYHYTLTRIDPGSYQVIAYGPAAIQMSDAHADA